MNIYYVTNKKPLSHNKRGSDPKLKEEIRKEFLDKYGHIYTGLPIKQRTLKNFTIQYGLHTSTTSGMYS